MKLTTNAATIAARVAAWDKRVGPALARATLHAATVTTAAAKREAPARTGKLRGSIAYQAGGQYRYTIAAGVPYDAPVQRGSRPHIIRPVRGRALAWPGARHPVRSVRHPGTKANPYMARALRASLPEIRRIARAAGGTIVGREA